MSNTHKDLKPNELKFAEAYIRSGNAKRSAIEAGYSSNGASTTGHTLLRRTRIAEYIRSRQESMLAQEQKVTDSLQQRVLAELEAMAFANIADFVTIDEDGNPQVDLSNATREQLRALTNLKTKKTSRYDGRGNHIADEVNVSVNMADKYRGLQLLGQTLGMFKEPEQKIVVDVADRLLKARQRVLTITHVEDVND